MKIGLVFLLLFIYGNSYAANPIWLNLDKALIKNLIKIDKDSISHFEAFFLKKNKNQVMENLGFGWKVWSPGIGGGYISITSEFYYFNDSLKSFRINADLPDGAVLRKKYLKWYDNFFKISNNNQLMPHLYNFRALSEPLSNYRGGLNNMPNFKIRNLMYPSSHVSYYFAGGYSGNIPQNRKVIMDLSDSLTFDQLEYLTYSINPETRFLALEELIRKELIVDVESEMYIWSERCFKEIPKIKTLNGCIGSVEDSKQLVYTFSQIKYR